MSDSPGAHTKPRERPLPNGWQRVKFGAVIAEAQPGFSSGQRDAKGAIQLRMNNVDTRGNLLWNEVIRVPVDSAIVERFSLRASDIVFNNTNSTALVGKSAVFTGHDEPVTYSNHFTRLRTRPDAADSGFVAFWLLSQWQSRVFERICNRWIGQSAVKTDQLFALEIPLPPLDEQRRIASRLNEQLAAVEAARKAAEEQLEAARKLPSAYLQEVFRGSSKNSWKWQKLGHVCQLLPARTIKSTGDAAVTAITTACLSENGFLPAGLKTARMDGNDTSEALVRPGEVLIARSNTPDLVGRVSMYPGEPAGIVASDLTIRIWANPSSYPPFLTAYLSYLYLSGFWKKMAGGVSGSMKKITRTQVLDVDIPVPAIDNQMQIVAGLQVRMDYARQLDQRLKSQLADIDNLPASMLRKAFRGAM